MPILDKLEQEQQQQQPDESLDTVKQKLADAQATIAKERQKSAEFHMKLQQEFVKTREALIERHKMHDLYNEALMNANRNAAELKAERAAHAGTRMRYMELLPLLSAKSSQTSQEQTGNQSSSDSVDLRNSIDLKQTRKVLANALAELEAVKNTNAVLAMYPVVPGDERVNQLAAELAKAHKELADLKALQEQMIKDAQELHRRKQISDIAVIKYAEMLAHAKAQIPVLNQAAGSGTQNSSSIASQHGAPAVQQNTVTLEFYNAERQRLIKGWEEMAERNKKQAIETLTQERQFCQIAKDEAKKARQDAENEKIQSAELKKEVSSLKEQLAQRGKEVEDAREEARQKTMQAPIQPPIASSSPANKRRKAGGQA